jgi:hypothetical protein
VHGDRTERRRASTSNPRYAINGIRPGATLIAAKQALPAGNLVHVGRNDWYLAPAGRTTAVLKVRLGIVEEIGIGDRKLTSGKAAQRIFMTSFECTHDLRAGPLM